MAEELQAAIYKIESNTKRLNVKGLRTRQSVLARI